MIEFDYRREQLRTGDVIFRPVAKVYLLRFDGDWIADYFYVDSGADYTLIPYRMGRFLGLVLRFINSVTYFRMNPLVEKPAKARLATTGLATLIPPPEDGG